MALAESNDTLSLAAWEAKHKARLTATLRMPVAALRCSVSGTALVAEKWRGRPLPLGITEEDMHDAERMLRDEQKRQQAAARAEERARRAVVEETVEALVTTLVEEQTAEDTFGAGAGEGVIRRALRDIPVPLPEREQALQKQWMAQAAAKQAQAAAKLAREQRLARSDQELQGDKRRQAAESVAQAEARRVRLLVAELGQKRRSAHGATRTPAGGGAGSSSATCSNVKRRRADASVDVERGTTAKRLRAAETTGDIDDEYEPDELLTTKKALMEKVNWWRSQGYAVDTALSVDSRLGELQAAVHRLEQGK